MTDEQDAAITAQEARAKQAANTSFNDALWLNTFGTVLSARLYRGDRVSEAIDTATTWADEMVLTNGRKA